ncbi:hypothetical protein, partial [Corynebacterium phocae]
MTDNTFSRRKALQAFTLGGVVLLGARALPAHAAPANSSNGTSHQTDRIATDFAELDSLGLPRFLVVSNPTDQPLDNVTLRINGRQLDQAGLLGQGYNTYPAVSGKSLTQRGPGVWTHRLPGVVPPKSTATFELSWAGVPAAPGTRLLGTLQLQTARESYYEVYTQEFIVGQPFSPSLDPYPETLITAVPDNAPHAEPAPEGTVPEGAVPPNAPHADPAPEGTVPEGAV